MPSPASATPTIDRPIKVLLIDDQAIVGESVRRMLADEPDIHFHFCKDPAQAISTANQIQPTVILQDLIMPEIDGLMLVKFFRANAVTKQTPMIVLSSKEEPVIKAKAFSLGANDYLVKLPDKLELIARIRYHSQAYIHLLERNDAYSKLEESQRLLAEEVQQAASYVKSLLPERLVGDLRSDWIFVPSTSLGGDMFGYHWLDDDVLAIYLLDVSGHGVGSSLLAVSAANILTSQSLADTDFREPAKVLTRLSSIFQMEKQNNKYFTILYAIYDRKARKLTYANAGHPPGLVLTGASHDQLRLEQLDSSGPGIGMFSGWEYERGEISLDRQTRLLLYSDGAFEIHLPDGKMWPHGAFVKEITEMAMTRDSVTQGMLDHIRNLSKTDVLADDCSMLDMHL